MNALISPNETLHDGVRIAQVSSETFEVAPPLYWISVADGVTPETHHYDQVNMTIVETPYTNYLVGNVASNTQPTSTGTQTL